MLVKILSYAASAVANSTRYKTAFISCLAVAFVLSGGVGLTMLHNERFSNAAHTATGSDNGTSQEDTLWLGRSDVDSRDTRAQEPATKAEQTTTDQENEPTDQETPENGSDERLKLTLSATDVSLTPDSTSSTLSASIEDALDLSQWIVTVDTEEAEGLTATSLETDEAATTFRIRASQDIAPGTYEITVHAVHEDDDKSELTATITVTVQSPRQ